VPAILPFAATTPASQLYGMHRPLASSFGDGVHCHAVQLIGPSHAAQHAACVTFSIAPDRLGIAQTPPAPHALQEPQPPALLFGVAWQLVGR